VISLTHCLSRLRGGDQTAAQQLWETYYCRLVGLARKKLEGRVRLVADEEDVALSAIKSFCRGIERGRYPQLSDEDDPWNLLVTITLHKVLHLVRDEGRVKRGGGRTALAARDDEDAKPLEQLMAGEPTPEFAVEVAEEAERLLGLLPKPDLVELALLKMEGYTNAEIANRWNKAERTVERKLNSIRQLWAGHFP
jgi:DNA-directed RNA polymerase specialized sigma24 family protein